MRKYLVTFRHQGAILQRVVEATSRDNAMGCVCGFVLSCVTLSEQGAVMKTFIVDYTIKTRNGHMRDYRRFVETDDLATAIEKMRLCLSGIAYGFYYKGAFRSATEVCSTEAFGYKCRNLIGGQYFFVRDGRLTEGTVKWNAFYDYKLKGWLKG